MATNLAIDPKLLNHALEVSGLRTKKEAVTVALREFIARRERAAIVDSFGTLDWDERVAVTGMILLELHGSVDALIAAIANDPVLLTTDRDFERAAQLTNAPS